MFQWRVTKYDPANRNAEGRYVHDEWTSISDVGKTFADKSLTLESYLRVESAYADTALRFIEESGAPRLFARGVERHEPTAVAGGDVLERPPEEEEEIALADVARLCRACLREVFVVSYRERRRDVLRPFRLRLLYVCREPCRLSAGPRIRAECRPFCRAVAVSSPGLLDVSASVIFGDAKDTREAGR